jgi:ribosomal protein S27AE
MGGLRLLVRVELVECPRCGKPLFQAVQGDNKSYRCGGPNCQAWKLRLVKEAGRALMLSLVMES